MKTINNINKLLLLTLTVFVFNCSPDDPNDGTIPVPNPCPNTEVFGLYSANYQSPMVDFMHFTNLNGSVVNTVNVNLNYGVNIHGAAYNNATSEYALVNTTQQELLKFDANGTLTATPIPAVTNPNFYTVTSPAYLNSSLYFGNLEYVGNTHQFSVLDSGYNLIASPNTVTLTAASVNYEFSISATTDNISHIYYLIGTNLVAYDTFNNAMTVSSITPSSFNGNYIGVEYYDVDKLLAIKQENGTNGELVMLDISNPAALMETPLLNLGMEINIETYSTAFDACKEKYLVVSNNFSGGYSFLEIDLTGTPQTNTTTAATGSLIGIVAKN
ncbi:MAG: hypothetical protein ACK5M1_13825 [Xanthomarina gelatinilytica]|uniref:hypothetical protein n=1 Tax=Xanthomarina gelatinilytica TaxID=1137281 RepID=UPI003A891F4D